MTLACTYFLHALGIGNRKSFSNGILDRMRTSGSDRAENPNFNQTGQSDVSLTRLERREACMGNLKKRVNSWPREPGLLERDRGRVCGA